MNQRKFAPGFRFSVTDGVALILIGWILLDTVAVLSLTRPESAFLVPAPLLAFFLFCNVFRVSRPLELTWAAVFVACSYCTIFLQSLSWQATTLISLAALVLIVGLEMRKPSYHGVGWKTINPQLPEWWANQTRQNSEVDVSIVTPERVDTKGTGAENPKRWNNEQA